MNNLETYLSILSLAITLFSIAGSVAAGFVARRNGLDVKKTQLDMETISIERIKRGIFQIVLAVGADGKVSLAEVLTEVNRYLETEYKESMRRAQPSSAAIEAITRSAVEMGRDELIKALADGAQRPAA